MNNSSWRTWEKQNRLISRPAHRLLESLGCYQPIEQMTTKTWLQFNSLVATTTIPCHATWWIQGRWNYLGRLGSVPTISWQFLCFLLIYFRNCFYLNGDQSFFFFLRNTLFQLNLHSFCNPWRLSAPSTTWTQCLLRLLWENWHDFCRNVITKWMMVVSFVAQSWFWILMSSFFLPTPYNTQPVPLPFFREIIKKLT